MEERQDIQAYKRKLVYDTVQKKNEKLLDKVNFMSANDDLMQTKESYLEHSKNWGFLSLKHNTQKKNLSLKAF
jgi:hypothetical protein